MAKRGRGSAEKNKTTQGFGSLFDWGGTPSEVQSDGADFGADSAAAAPVSEPEIDVEALASEIHRHNILYNSGSEEISDADYDRLVEKLRRIAPAHPVLVELTTPDVNSDGKVVHKTQMLSLEKAEKGKEMAQIANWLKQDKSDFIATPKIDGLACSIRYDENGRIQVASTRGNGAVGENITKNALYIQGIPVDIERPGLEIRGEVYMPLTAFDAFEGEKRSARNLAVGGLKQKDARETERYGLCFFAYDILNFESLGEEAPKTEIEKYDLLQKLGFTTVESRHFERHAVVPGELLPVLKSEKEILGEIEAFCHEMELQRASWNFDADGLVFKFNDISAQERLGVTAHHPKCAIAYKFACDTGKTILRSVDWQLAKGGTVTPVANFDPILLAGAMVRRATLSNLGQVKAFKTRKPELLDAEFNDPNRAETDKFIEQYLYIGAELLVSRRGDVIPHVEYVIATPDDAVMVPIPDKCPSCGAKVVEDGLFLRCSDPENCPSTGQALIENYAKVVGVMGLGEKIIAALYDTGLVRTPADLYRLSIADIGGALSQETDGSYDEKAVLPEKLYTAIQNARHLELDVFLESLSIPALGKVTSHDLAAYYQTLDALLNADDESIGKALKASRKKKKSIEPNDETIKENQKTSKKAKALSNQKTANAICIGLKNRKSLIDALLKYIQIDTSMVGGVFSGKSFLFTGTLESMKRDEAETRVKTLGGTIAGSVKKDLSFLVATSKTTTKWKKAEELNEKGANIQCLEEAEFLKLLEDAENSAQSE